MQSQDMAQMGGVLFFIIYAACVIGILILLLRLLWRFVAAHEKMAASLDIIARKLKDETRS